MFILYRVLCKFKLKQYLVKLSINIIDFVQFTTFIIIYITPR